MVTSIDWAIPKNTFGKQKIKKGVYIMNKIAKICYGLGFASIALSAYVYGTSGVADATYVGLWVPSFFLVGDFFDRHA